MHLNSSSKSSTKKKSKFNVSAENNIGEKKKHIGQLFWEWDSIRNHIILPTAHCVLSWNTFHLIVYGTSEKDGASYLAQPNCQYFLNHGVFFLIQFLTKK
jgi:hypothetical protein